VAASVQAWQAFAQHAARLRGTSLRALCAADPARGKRHVLSVAGLRADFSRQLLDDAALDALLALAEAAGHRAAVAALIGGDDVNTTEGRPALHTALRDFGTSPRTSRAAAAAGEAAAVRARMRQLCAEWDADAQIRDVIHVGIGGSDLGPRLACEALAGASAPRLRVHFLANVDGHAAAALLARLDPQRTRVCLVSKSFGTQETLLNGALLRDWLGAGAAQRMFAVTANVAAAAALGVPSSAILPMWDWVGGRYSLWSAVGLPIALMHGMDAFERLLAGAWAMDRHYAEAAPQDNLPLRMALVGIWNRNALGLPTLALAPYDERLRLLPAWLQQTEMESNGKRVDLDGQPLARAAAPVVWGDVGTNAQHAYFQSLHQGVDVVPVDFVGVLRAAHGFKANHDALLANLLAQSAALMQGDDGGDGPLAAHRASPGERPSSLLLLDELVPETLGALLALYEHKVHAQGVIWGLNSFDQWGVQLGKRLADGLLPAIAGSGAAKAADAITLAQIAAIRVGRQA
jgi:glucose-6-phosphate isomerase